MRTIHTPRDLGNAIRRARHDRGWTQWHLAKLAGVGRPWLSELETGKRTVELGMALDVLDALGLAVTLAPVARPKRVDLNEILHEHLDEHR